MNFFEIIVFPLAAFSATINESLDTSIFIRIENLSAYDLHNIIATSPAYGSINFGFVKAGQQSKYKEVASAYATTAVSAEINNVKVEFVPDDYLGEQLLNPGKYTYEVTVTEANGIRYLRLKLKRINE